MNSAIRPTFHFAPARFWMNDPNGLVYLGGEYHLFYQFNPTASEWGQIGWGHAVSRDLINWTELAEALPANECGMAFSGSAVVDLENTSGFSDKGTPAMVAIYTFHSTAGDIPHQSQHLAWSVDCGRNWQRYEGNPVLDIGSGSFRDPKVFWHTESAQWIMAIVLASECKVQFYGSPNLLEWSYLSDFGPCGNTEGEWECPDLFPLTIEDGSNQRKWILKVDNTLGGVAGGSGGQYFVGEFDGTRFRSEGLDDQSARDSRPVDYGSDFYAAMTWSNTPADDRRIWLAWMSNWHYANSTPTHPWRGVQSCPRSLHLVSTNAGLRLAQRPVEELRQLRRRHGCWKNVNLAQGQSLLLEDSSGETLELALQVNMGPDALITLHFLRSSGSTTTVSFDNKSSELMIDRRGMATTTFHPDFSACHRGPLSSDDGIVDIRILLDHCCLEVFGGKGETVITDLVFPDGSPDGVTVTCEQGAAVIETLDLWHLDASHEPATP